MPSPNLRCTATRRDGERCRNRMVPYSNGRCRQHGGFLGVRPRTCRCIAYQWPHRPGGGLCHWPAAPSHRLTTPPSTHRERSGWARSWASLFRRVWNGTGDPAAVLALAERLERPPRPRARGAHRARAPRVSTSGRGDARGRPSVSLTPT
jgi:hypothetical protein